LSRKVFYLGSYLLMYLIFFHIFLFSFYPLLQVSQIYTNPSYWLVNWIYEQNSIIPTFTNWMWVWCIWTYILPQSIWMQVVVAFHGISCGFTHFPAPSYDPFHVLPHMTSKQNMVYGCCKKCLLECIGNCESKPWTLTSLYY
jgi:hypothetical protein